MCPSYYSRAALHLLQGKTVSRQMGFNKSTFLEIPSSRVFENFCWSLFLQTHLPVSGVSLSEFDWWVNYCASIISQQQYNFLHSLLLSWVLSWYWQFKHQQKCNSHIRRRLNYKDISPAHGQSLRQILSPSTEILNIVFLAIFKIYKPPSYSKSIRNTLII